MAYYATGDPINMEIITQVKYSFDRSENISIDFDPLTFLIPISFVRRSVINEESPIRPRHEMMIARNEE